MEKYPVLMMKKQAVLPFGRPVIRFNAQKEGSKIARGDKVILVMQSSALMPARSAMDMVRRTGVLCVVRDISEKPESDTVVVSFRALERFILMDMSYDREAEMWIGQGEQQHVFMDMDEAHIKAIASELKTIFGKGIFSSERRPGANLAWLIDTFSDIYSLYRIAEIINPDAAFIQSVLDASAFGEAAQIVLKEAMQFKQVEEIRREIDAEVRKRMEERQKEFILREQIKVIREKLGEEDDIDSEAEAFEKQAMELDAPEEVKTTLQKEIGRLRSLKGSASEASVTRGYIETMLSLPWNKVTEESQDLAAARRILNEDHYGLEDVKERILEFLAVRILSGKGDAPILCLAGPPGTGKTSIAKSLARALNREYVRISLGGVRDEAEIRGHRKTYIGAMPGRIADALRKAKVSNPVMLLDEIDKTSSDYKGDVSSALLEVLDPAQNKYFADHYVQVPIDLSRVLFICTANDTRAIPRPLLDRMELVEIGSYTDPEKKQIAKRHLLPRQLASHGLGSASLTITSAAMDKIISDYTREAGVRQLERRLGEICRKAALKILEDHQEKVTVKVSDLNDFLGKEIKSSRKHSRTDEVGIASGLAWTAVGGTTLTIEVNVMPGTGKLILTGSLGDVMKESARIGLGYLRSIASQWNIDPEFFTGHDIHLHIPEGAVPKDGPSAGITMTLAMLSAITGKKIRADAAMTGEISLRGHVLAVGGLKEKLLAARKASMNMVVVPAENRVDIEELSHEITGNMKIVYVKEMREVQETLLL